MEKLKLNISRCKRLLFMYECMSYESDFHLRSCKQKKDMRKSRWIREVCWLWLLLQNVSRLCI